MSTNLNRIGSMDFTDTKSSIQQFISNTPEFTDYAFAGSGLSALINVLAYNSHYSALAANLIGNETFLDTAVKRSSVVSRSKELGYVPRSVRSSKSTVTLTLSNVPNANLIGTVVAPQGTRFTTSIGQDSYSFVSLAAVSIPKIIELGQPIFRTTFDVYEGVLTQQVETYSALDNLVKIANIDIDTSTLKVEVNEGSGYVEYVKPTSFLTIGPTSKVYLIQEGYSGYEIYFGDGTLGYQPSDSTQIRLTYIVASGTIANGAVNFTLTSALNGTTGSTSSVIATVSAGGSDIESIASIKLNAPNQYGAQLRAVVPQDYATLSLQQFPEIQSCIAWDGSDSTPPDYGSVVICAKPAVGDVLTTPQKTNISAYLKTKGIANTRVKFVDPTYIDLIINSTVRFDKNVLNIGVYELEYAIQTAIYNYANSTVNTFNGKLKGSNLGTLIDNSNSANVSNLTSISMLYKYTPVQYSNNNLIFNYSNQIKAGTFKSTIFFDGKSSNNLYLMDDGLGNINSVYDVNSIPVVYQTKVGTINYTTGYTQINQLYIATIQDFYLRLTVDPVQQDLLSVNNVILRASIDNIITYALPDYQ
jgi:hypothetical protein